MIIFTDGHISHFLLVDLDPARVDQNEVNVLFESEALAIAEAAHLYEDEEAVQETDNTYDCRQHGLDAHQALDVTDSFIE